MQLTNFNIIFGPFTKPEGTKLITCPLPKNSVGNDNKNNKKGKFSFIIYLLNLTY